MDTNKFLFGICNDNWDLKLSISKYFLLKTISTWYCIISLYNVRFVKVQMQIILILYISQNRFIYCPKGDKVASKKSLGKYIFVENLKWLYALFAKTYIFTDVLDARMGQGLTFSSTFAIAGKVYPLTYNNCALCDKFLHFGRQLGMGIRDCSEFLVGGVVLFGEKCP